jgi:hypothetical protein
MEFWLIRNISLYFCYNQSIWWHSDMVFDSIMRVQHSPNLCDGNPFLRNHCKINYKNQSHNDKIPDSQLVKLFRSYLSPKFITLSITALQSQSQYSIFCNLHSNILNSV